jgi:hypothetical protein
MIQLDQLTAIHTSLDSLLSLISMDAINGLFELSAGFFVLNHCRVLHAHKQVRGVSLTSSGFFLIWGVWNMYYYPALNQPLSFYGGVFVVAANAFYLGMMLRYRNAEALAAVLDEHELYLGVESTGSYPAKKGGAA